MALFLEHQAEGLPELKHTGAPQMFYRWHGSVWSRYPLPVKIVPEGAVLRQKNAYVSIPFLTSDGPSSLETLRRCLVKPLVVSAGAVTTEKKVSAANEQQRLLTNRLARPGEAGDSPIPKLQIWDALRDCKDAQLYTADISIVELGLIYDVRVRGDVVTVVMAMPHRGRPMIGYFTDGSISVHPTFSLPVRERLMRIKGVKQVVVEQTWEPGWNSNRVTIQGRKKLGLGE
jgi:metal-sulfur cluster biosynthetic enzyme